MPFRTARFETPIYEVGRLLDPRAWIGRTCAGPDNTFGVRSDDAYDMRRLLRRET